MTIQSVKYLPASDQEAFDTALVGVLAQGMPSRRSDGSCLYEHDGLQCGIGHGFTPIDARAIERRFPASSIRNLISKECVQINESIDIDLLARLQLAHDNAAIMSRQSGNFIEEFKKNMSELAIQYDLEYTEL